MVCFRSHNDLLNCNCNLFNLSESSCILIVCKYQILSHIVCISKICIIKITNCTSVGKVAWKLICLIILLLQVRDLVEKCTCPTQFPMIRVSEGKYRIGDTKVLIFVRVSRESKTK